MIRANINVHASACPTTSFVEEIHEEVEVLGKLRCPRLLYLLVIPSANLVERVEGALEEGSALVGGARGDEVVHHRLERGFPFCERSRQRHVQRYVQRGVVVAVRVLVHDGLHIIGLLLQPSYSLVKLLHLHLQVSHCT